MSNTSSKVRRAWPAPIATDEMRLHLDFLAFLRATAVNKVAGLTRELAAAAPLPTSPRMSALGVLKHLTAVERWWLSIEAGGKDHPSLWAGSPDPSWDLTPEDAPASVIRAYRDEWARTEKSLTGLIPDDRTRRSREFTVRWVLEHEFADGEVGE